MIVQNKVDNDRPKAFTGLMRDKKEEEPWRHQKSGI